MLILSNWEFFFQAYHYQLTTQILLTPPAQVIELKYYFVPVLNTSFYLKLLKSMNNKKNFG